MFSEVLRAVVGALKGHVQALRSHVGAPRGNVGALGMHVGAPRGNVDEKKMKIIGFPKVFGGFKSPTRPLRVGRFPDRPP